MRSISDTHPATLATPFVAPMAFDPFGEFVTAGMVGTCPSGTGDRTARWIGSAVFWSLALATLAGRIYAYDMPVVSQVAAYATQVVALR
ncbi:hypothetical protein [Methylobacterium longum]|uniref:Uncharacterized protein n=1 Tax=Methylobacterium longum TaxID=767694 RepID=A0ABT8AJ93_9HYPH|nr:hypothetical protein [Methylobacterium longum]MDN3569927.1 hypothetical protein [Methylobacterium longum]GJE14294.1 hypothetical protein FOHLNKBM_5368 [Methylobacterium longum]